MAASYCILMPRGEAEIGSSYDARRSDGSSSVSRPRNIQTANINGGSHQANVPIMPGRAFQESVLSTSYDLRRAYTSASPKPPGRLNSWEHPGFLALSFCPQATSPL